MKKSFLNLLVIPLFIGSLFTGCTNLFNKDTGFGIIRFSNGNASRNASAPENNLTDIVLTGTYNNKTRELGRWATFNDALLAEISIPTGNWSFTLEATELPRNYKSPVINKTIKPGNNTLSFDMEITPFLTTIEDFSSLYTKIAQANKKGTAEIYKIKVSEPIETHEQLQTITQALSTVQNNTYISLEIDLRTINENIQLSEENKAKAIKELVIINNSSSTQILTNLNNYIISRITTEVNSPKLDNIVIKGNNIQLDSLNGMYTKNLIFLGNNIKVGLNCLDDKNVENIKSLGNNITFNNNPLSGLKTLEISGKNSFLPAQQCNLTSLEKAIITSDLQTIPNSYFTVCKNLTTVVLPKTLKTIENNAFNGCKDTLQITFESPENWYCHDTTQKKYIPLNLSKTIKLSDLEPNLLKYSFVKIDDYVPLKKDIKYILNNKPIPSPIKYSKKHGIILPKVEDLSLPEPPAGSTLTLQWYIQNTVNGQTSNIQKNILTPEECESPNPITVYGTYSYETTPDNIGTLYNSFTTPGTYNVILKDKITTPDSWNKVKTALTQTAEKAGVNVALSVGFSNMECTTKGAKQPATGATSVATAVTEVTILPGTITIGNFIFQNFTNLHKVTLDGTVTNCGDRTFDGCSLSEIDYKGTLTQWCTIDHHYSRLHPPTVKENETTDPEYKLIIDGREITTEITIPSDVTTLSTGVFKNCHKLTKVVIPETVTSAGGQAFAYCKKLATVNIPTSFTEIPEKMFYICPSITGEITIPTGITKIGGEAFGKCKGITKIVLPNTLTTILAGAFKECPLTTITIPSSVKSISKDFLLKTNVPKVIFEKKTGWSYKIKETDKPTPLLDTELQDSATVADYFKKGGKLFSVLLDNK